MRCTASASAGPRTRTGSTRGRRRSFPEATRPRCSRGCSPAPSTGQVVTRRLDDVLPPGPVDFLKLDVQGAELMVLQGGPATVAAAAVVHCEVEFSPIYAGQPLYADIHRALADHGFALIDFLNQA